MRDSRNRRISSLIRQVMLHLPLQGRYHALLKRLTFFILLALALEGCSNTPPNHGMINLPGVNLATTPVAAGNINAVRLQALQDEATSFGAQAGLAWQGRKINGTLKQQTKKLDQVFAFNQLLLKDNVLPPVLAEGRQQLNLADDRTIRLADRIYEIKQPPRFVTAPPTWRDYLWLNFAPPDPPPVSLLPKNTQEKQVWNHCIKLGWENGVAQANQIFAANLGRLKRDFAGMVLYRQLLAQNMVTPPYVSKLNLGVTGDANSLRIGDQVLRISAVSELNTDAKTWRPVILPNDDP